MHADQPLASRPTWYGPATWTSARWRDDVTGWLDDRLAALGERRTGEVEQPHLRPWSTALRAETSCGTVWLKAPGPGAAFEVSLYPVLAALAGEHVLPPLAVDVERRWLLLPDGGPVLGDVLQGRPLIDALCAAVAAYGQLQLDLAGSVDELLDAGVPDMRVHVMASRLAEALEVVRPYVESSHDDADRATYERLRRTQEEFTRACGELGRSVVPASLQHGDLHPHNIFSGARAGSAPVFFDWGDSAVAHPFTTMLVTLRVVRSLAAGDSGGRDVVRVRDAYLEPFASLAPRRELVDELERACHIGKVARSLTWAAQLSGLPAADAAADADIPFAWLALVLDSSYLGDVDAD
jgi:Phosphotransferase enzyme family